MIISILNGLAKETATRLQRRRRLLVRALENKKLTRSAADAAYLVKQIDFEMLFRK